MIEAGQHFIKGASFVLYSHNQGDFISIRNNFRTLSDDNETSVVVIVAIDSRSNDL